MIKELENNRNGEIFKFFREISAIPRGSGNTGAISDYLTAFAISNKLEYYQDKLGNVIIIKEAHKERSNSPAIMLQGHMDMVCEKHSDSTHDFSKDGLELVLENDFLHAKGTTLGGDDGIALAYSLALLSNNELRLPRLECVFTIDEETGMEGAFGIDLSPCQASYMINLDSESEGIFFAGCAGGTVLSASLPLDRKTVKGLKYSIILNGLKGGHSGDEIDKGRGNANIIMGRLINSLISQGIQVNLLSFNGGSKHNAITRDCIIELCITDENDLTRLAAHIESFASMIKSELTSADKDFNLKLAQNEQQPAEYAAFTDKELTSLLAMTFAIPNGVIAMSQDIDNLVESSTNLGVTESSERKFSCTYLVRSSVESRMEELLQRMELILNNASANTSRINPYPGWKYDPASKLRAAMVKTWREMFNSEPEIKAIHAGLECGILLSKKPDLDVVSIGPDILDIHTTEEKLSICSSIRVYEFILAFLSQDIFK